MVMTVGDRGVCCDHGLVIDLGAWIAATARVA